MNIDEARAIVALNDGPGRIDRAYERLAAAAQNGTEINLADHDLVLAIQRAIWKREMATAQIGLTELEIRTAADTVFAAERRAAA